MKTPYDHTSTSSTRIPLTGPVNIGGSAITSFELICDQSTSSWIYIKELSSVDITTTYTILGFTSGLSYLFKVRAKNALGWGPYLSIVTITPSSISL